LLPHDEQVAAPVDRDLRVVDELVQLVDRLDARPPASCFVPVGMNVHVGARFVR
jgi:hypothetical protein